ncbi:MAG: hypothetical protein Q8L45_14875 [Xanthomonadaceae bacterium]|nr:hypothetical protein [Xanthomonadaceae bacterium]MDP2185335.1 hypothetical protein [Xanthomonadales bacterium]MDZ4115766.1 hypothetical protein [Xanthomonadaceae bacterium]
MNGRDCPRWESCAANVCPLDADWRKRSHLKGEPVCLWLREVVKPDGEAILRASIGDDAAAQVVAALPAIEAAYGTLRRALKRASQHGSRVASGRKLRGA